MFVRAEERETIHRLIQVKKNRVTGDGVVYDRSVSLCRLNCLCNRYLTP
jgi:hypothetical protein